MAKAEKIILQTTKEILALLEIKDAKVEVEKSGEGKEGEEGKGEILRPPKRRVQDKVWKIQIETEKKGILIGFHGETISALQLLVSLIVYKKLGQWQPLVLNVGDYREKRKLQLEKMAENAAQRVKFSGQAVALPFLSGAERRIIHMALAQDDQVETESEGEGRERKLVIKPKIEADMGDEGNKGDKGV